MLDASLVKYINGWNGMESEVKLFEYLKHFEGKFLSDYLVEFDKNILILCVVKFVIKHDR